MRPESSDAAARTELREMVVRLVHSSEQPRYQELMRENHAYESITLSAKQRRKILAKVLWWVGKAP